MPIAIFALALASFSIGTAEFIIAGILPHLASDFDVSIPTAGLLVTGYAVAVAIGGPILAMLTAHLPRKPTLVAMLAIFVLGQVFCALAPSYPWLMAARIFCACTHGLFYGIGSVAAADAVPPAKRGTALALFLGGVTVANVLGVPGGTAIGNAIGWRAAFWLVGAFALVATILVARLLPATNTRHEQGTTLRAEIRALGHQQVYLAYLLIAIVMVGALTFATYQVPVMTVVSGIPEAWTPLYLVISGIGTIAGMYAGGRAADWKLMPSLIAILLVQAAGYAFMLVAMHQPIAMLAAMFVTGAMGFAFNSPVQTRILAAAQAAPNLAATLISTAFNIGIASGAWVGGTWINAGLGYASLPTVSIACSLLGTVVGLVSWRLDAGDRRLD